MTSGLEIATDTFPNMTKTFSLVTKNFGYSRHFGDCFCLISKRLKVGKNFFGPVFALLQNELIKIMQIKSVYLQRLT